MTDGAPPAGDRFEDRLLHQLHAELPAPPASAPAPAPAPAPQTLTRRHRHRLLLGAGGLATAAVVAVAGVVTVTATAPAYAIHSRADGSFVVVLDGTAEEDLAAAERELRGNGARIELVAATLDCLDPLAPPDPSLPAEPHGPLPTGAPPAGMFPWFDAFQAVGGSGDERRNPVTGKRLRADEWAFTVRPGAIPPDQVLWIAVYGPGIPGTGLVTVAGFAATGAGPPQFCMTA